MAAAKAADAVYGVTPPPAARKLRELLYNGFYVTRPHDALLRAGRPRLRRRPRRARGRAQHPGRHPARSASRSAAEVIQQRARGPARRRRSSAAGRPPGDRACRAGMSKRVTKEEQQELDPHRRGDGRVRASSTLQVFEDVVLENTAYVDLILSDTYCHKTYSMGLVDAQRQGQLLRRHGAGRGPRRQRVLPSYRPERLPRAHRGARRALDLPQVPVPEAGRLEGLRGRHGLRRLPRDARSRGSTSPTAWPRRSPRPTTSGSTRP